MCRWITLLSAGEPMSLSDIILTPSNSLIQLSKDASFHPGFMDLNNHVTNGDGFGIGWYHTNYAAQQQTNTTTKTAVPPIMIINPNQASSQHNHNHNTIVATVDVSNRNNNAMKTKEQQQRKKLVCNAAVFKDTQPAWNNANLRELCMAVQSRCIMAHVRAASAFAPNISQQNCHPFKAGRLLFCHNGRIDQFDLVRRKFHSLLSDEAFLSVKGTTDSEIIFALLCTYLSEDGSSASSPYSQTESFGHVRLTGALKKVLRTIERILEEVGIQDDGYSTCNFSLTDGETMVVTRFCDKSPTVPPPSLYFAFGDSTQLYEELTHEQTTTVVPPSYTSQTSNISDDSSQKTSGSDSASSLEELSSSDFDEKPIDVERYDTYSQPGTVYADVDVNDATFIVASCPLTKTHAWHPMPKNSIMWYTKGSLPELRLLKRRIVTRSFVLSK